MKKILLVTQSFPPSTGGSATLIWQLVKYWDADELMVVHGTPESNPTKFVTCPVTFGTPNWTIRLQKHLAGWYIKAIERQIKKVISDHQVSHLYLHYPNAPFVVAGYRVARELGLPYSIYFDILWEERAQGSELKLSQRYEHELVKGASNRFAITEFAVEHLTQKHGVAFELIPHTVDINPQALEVKTQKATSVTKVIHFAGGIYPRMNSDSLERIYRALCEMELDFVLELYSRQLPQYMKDDPRVKQAFVSREELMERQKAADLLLLPQAFNSDTPLMIQNNLPTKTMEYLISGAPILVHSPRDSYLTWLMKKNNCAYIVDLDSVEELKKTIFVALDNHNSKYERISNAIMLARQRSSVVMSEKIKRKLLSI